MASHALRALTLTLALLLGVPLAAAASGVHVLFDLSRPAGGPFPSDRFTVADPSHHTGVRVNLPRPDCAIRVTDCLDLDVLNTLDGFNVQPRLAIPFSGAIDVTSVSSNSVFLVRLGSTRGGRHRHVVGINQIVWEPTTNTLYAESDELLEQHTRYALIVTDGVRDTSGHRVGARDFARFLLDHDRRHREDDTLKDYRKDLLEGIARAGVSPWRIAAVSVFTTQSTTAVLEKIRDRIKAEKPAPATMFGAFPLAGLTVMFSRQTGTSTFVNTPLPLALLSLYHPGAVGSIAFGKYASPDYQTAEKYIPAIGTRTGQPVASSTSDIYFNLVLPAGTPPAGGWPVAIFGHGFTDSKQGAPLLVAESFAMQGIATIAINVVGHGGGALGTLSVLPEGPTFSAGGRGIDQDGNGAIDSTEGVNAAFPRGLIGSRDGLRQTVVDLMQLVRVIETGGIPGLSRKRIYYAGQSFGGIYGTMFLAVEPSVRAGVPNVPGGAIIEIARISPSFRGLVTLGLAARIPALLNALPVAPPLLGFNENIPLRDQPPLLNTVPGAIAIQEVIENTEWASQAGNPVAYAPHIRKSPLEGMDDKPVIFQFAKGDRTVPNPTTSAILRAGDLADVATYFRNDLADAANSAFPNNPHTFLTNVVPLPFPGGQHPDVVAVGLAAQAQMATFFASDGTVVIDPDGAAPLFEVPIADEELPETLNFLP